MRIHMKPGSGISQTSNDSGKEAEACLHQFLQDNTALLLGIIRSYIVRMGLAQGEAVQALALDTLQDVAIEALSHAERFDPATQPRAWLLAIASNILKRKRTELTRSQQREIHFSDLTNAEGSIETLPEETFFALLTQRSTAGPEQHIEDDEQVREMLSLIPEDDRQVLQLAVLYDLDTQTLARTLGVTPGAARVRLHRALQRLRIAWTTRTRQGKRGEKHV